MRLLVIFLLLYCLVPLGLGWALMSLSRWVGWVYMESAVSQRWVECIVWTLISLGMLVLLGLRLATPVGYPGILIGAAPFIVPGLLLWGCLVRARRHSPKPSTPTPAVATQR